MRREKSSLGLILAFGLMDWALRAFFSLMTGVAFKAEGSRDEIFELRVLEVGDEVKGFVWIVLTR